MSNHSIVVFLNNYSYFQRDKINGPKSLIYLLGLLSNSNVEIILILKNKSHQKIPSSSEFPFQCKIHASSFFSNLKNVNKCSLIISDRANVIKGIFFSIFFNKKHVLRLLGMGRRLKSKSLFSYKNLLYLLTLIKPINLLIATNDGSSYGNFPFLKSKKELFRINGVESISLNIKDDKDFSKFVFLGRNAEEKGLVDAINYFSLVSEEIKNAKLIVIGIDEEEGSHICLRLKLNELKEKIEFKGYIFDDEKYEIISESKWMISGNKLGCLGNSEIECLSLGLRIIYLYEENIKYLPKKFLPYFESKKSFIDNVRKDSRFKLLENVIVDNFYDIHTKDAKEILSFLMKK